jgi:hypothetical protein
MSELLEKIRSRGHWRVVIRPGTFNKERVPNIAALYPILQKTSVQLRGWDFPHLDTQTKLHIDKDWIGQEIDWQQYLELWRFYQSGQFVHFSAMAEDWFHEFFGPLEPGYDQPGLLLSVERTVFRFTEIFEFASRLALTEAGDAQMHLEIGLVGINNRCLWVNAQRRMPFDSDYKASIRELPYQVNVSHIELISAASELALRPAVELFQRFGWDPSLEMLRDIQAELLHRGQRVVG